MLGALVSPPETYCGVDYHQLRTKGRMRARTRREFLFRCSSEHIWSCAHHQECPDCQWVVERNAQHQDDQCDIVKIG